MDAIPTCERRRVAPDIDAFTLYTPVPGFGVLPVNAYLVRVAEPVLIDTGIVAHAGAYLEQIAAAIDLDDLRYVWLTHTDPDHVGCLDQVLAAAPRARLVTTYLGMGKLNLSRPIPPERVHLLNPGQALAAGDRALHALRPPIYDAPETTAVFDAGSRALFSADCFGALLAAPAERMEDIGRQALREGMITWASVDAPWLGSVDPAALARGLQSFAALDPALVLSSHLPPARASLGELSANLMAAQAAPPFVGPDQAALEQMLAAA